MIAAMAERVIYLDHNATTPCDPRVVEAMLPFMTEKLCQLDDPQPPARTRCGL